MIQLRQKHIVTVPANFNNNGLPGTDVLMEIKIDVHRLVTFLANKALRTKTRKATGLHGMVVLREVKP